VAQVLNLLDRDPALVSRPRSRWFAQIEAYRVEIADQIQKEIEAGVGREGQLLVKTIVSRLSDLTGGKDLIVGDVGQHQMILARFTISRLSTAGLRRAVPEPWAAACPWPSA
jgi:acetolactate synthase-1/2/3 large subunit